MRRSFKLYPSHWLALCIIFGHCAAIGSLAMLPIPKLALVLLFAVLGGSSIYFVLRNARLAFTNSWVELILEEDRITLLNRKGDEQTGILLRNSLVTPYLVILNVKLFDCRWKQNLVVMPDSMDSESFRGLRVALKWGVVLPE